MRGKVVRRSVVIVSALLILSFGFYWAYRAHRRANISYANSILYDLNIEVELLEHWKDRYSTDRYLEKRIKHLILSNLLTVSRIKPPIKDLHGTPVEALYRIIRYNNEYTLSLEEGDSVFEVIRSYLESIENDVVSSKKEHEEMFKNLMKNRRR